MISRIHIRALNNLHLFEDCRIMDTSQIAEGAARECCAGSVIEDGLIRPVICRGNEMSDNRYDGLKLENQVCFPLYAASREVIKQYRPYLDPLDLTYTQYIAMMVFWSEKKINVKALGEKLFLDSGTLTPVLKSLESKGYVKRYRSREDERVLMVEITREGEALKEKAVDVPARMANCVNLNSEDAMQLYTLLYKLLGKLHKD